ncbi:DUF5658 family protein [Methanospirillum hungatei]|uniref:DUF5658 family protein n=1 Tax=Methanospirillum hungatei TaxID=2203 RepID=UPI0026F2E04D|nr:DUF5658 family protein [Methanospirillum hungatei]MCA1916211.1 DUF5658 family protein [Methanospirillum hungatei]
MNRSIQVSHMGIYGRTGTRRKATWIGQSQISHLDLPWMIAITALFSLQVLDLLTTKLVLDYGGVELNPVFHIFQHTLWFWPIMTLAKILFLIWAYYSLSTAERRYPFAAWITFVILIIQAIAVVGNNILVLITLFR